jgi:hypothetical protein
MTKQMLLLILIAGASSISTGIMATRCMPLISTRRSLAEGVIQNR